ncbi:cob(I)yrinic acid a,c-diamide adenosyltransferase [Corynebacterium aquilae]|uniref:Cobinamide adenolsyltransferase n=1 Tax=Corynebacterium aquilae DSM 44791 TaxID=1431546 RepID=A0A1L7CGI8_9CORY|nr:cob(I)yrinic acid a,c-diamide adenosyltransferase [Corynebacterium aquilae]APT84981.1 cobinamide adenolsyltransferase [Corynebacterium aquilae DSM 44791]
MPKGKLDPASIPDDGLTTRQRRMLPITAVHTGPGKGKSTAAFGMAMRAWNQGMKIGVFQFVKSPKWKVGEETVFRTLGELHDTTGQGGPVEWHKMGEGWSWAKKAGSEEDHARDAHEGWLEVKKRLENHTHDFYVLDEFTYPLTWGWIDIDDVCSTLANRTGTQHVVMTGRNAPEQLIDVADLVTEMTKIKHPMDQGRKGQKGIEW